jgi:hypothetical protein
MEPGSSRVVAWQVMVTHVGVAEDSVDSGSSRRLVFVESHCMHAACDGRLPRITCDLAGHRGTCSALIDSNGDIAVLALASFDGPPTCRVAELSLHHSSGGTRAAAVREKGSRLAGSRCASH